jgi:hypothetical protein
MKKKGSAKTDGQTRNEKPLAKRNDPDYEQVSAYLPKKLNDAVVTRLRQQGEKRGFSDLLERLLTDWLKR